MTMGLEWDEPGRIQIPPTADRHGSSTDRYRFILEQPIVASPARAGSTAEATALLGWLIAQGTGRSLPVRGRLAVRASGITTFEWAQGADSSISVRTQAPATILDRPTAAGSAGTSKRSSRRHGLPKCCGACRDRRPRVRLPLVHGHLADQLQHLQWIAAFGNGGQQLWIIPGREPWLRARSGTTTAGSARGARASWERSSEHSRTRGAMG